MRSTPALEEARREMDICNACRYCEGYCAVFPAMEMRRDFSNGDLSYLANLCHNCRGCYYACQYAPPHEFAINLPKTFAEVRVDTYKEYAWPRPLADLFERNGVIVALVTIFAVTAAMLLTTWLQSPDILYAEHRGEGAFYRVIPWLVMVLAAGGTFGFSLVAMGVGFHKFWRDTGGYSRDMTHPEPLARAASDVLTLRNLGGGGHGCNDFDESFSMARRWMHHALFYGFMLCFASTSVATIYDHYLGLQAPYPFFSLPVQLGTWGGLGMMVGTAGLFWIKLASDQTPAARNVLGADYALLVLLFLTAATGLLLLGLRETSAMGILLAIHLGTVLALFMLLPYCKFIHGIYRSAALLRWAIEKRRHGMPKQKDTLIGQETGSVIAGS